MLLLHMAVHMVSLVVVHMVVAIVVSGNYTGLLMVHMVVDFVVTMLVDVFELVVVQKVLTMKHMGQHRKVLLLEILHTTEEFCKSAWGTRRSTYYILVTLHCSFYIVFDGK